MEFHNGVYYTVKVLKAVYNLFILTLLKDELKTCHRNVLYDCCKTEKETVLGLGSYVVPLRGTSTAHKMQSCYFMSM